MPRCYENAAQKQIRAAMPPRPLAMLAIFLFGLIGFGSNAGAEEFRQIVVATGSPQELGLVDALAAVFQKTHGGVVRCVKTPTGPGLDLGRHGLAHITIGHEKDATDTFAAEGYASRRADLMHNYTVIVGPPEDPAGIRGIDDLREAHRKIYQAEAAYLSRGDGGGMHILEMKMWKALGLDPGRRKGYEVSGRFMLASLLHADAQKQYHMLDSSTWTLNRSKTRNLALLVQGPPNRYEICLVSAQKHPHLNYNRDLAEAFFDFLTGAEGQRVIAGFGVREYDEPVYHPSGAAR